MPGEKANALRVSVVVPAYQCAATISRALASALAQEPAPHEILVVDDGSADDTARIAQKTDSTVRVIRQDNAGASAARNRGITEATGDIVAFLDADDEWLPGRLAKGLAPFADDERVGMTWCRLWRTHPDGSREVYGLQFDRYLIFPGHFWPSAMHQTSGTMARRDALERAGGFDTTLRSREDQDLWIRLREEWRVVEIPEPIAIYHETASSLSKTTGLDRMRRDYFDILEHGLARRPDLYGKHETTIRAEAHWHWGLKYLAADMRNDARREFARSLGKAPRARVAAAWLATLLPSNLTRRIRRRLRRGATSGATREN